MLFLTSVCLSGKQKSSAKCSANENKLLLAFEWLFRENLLFKTTLCKFHEVSEGASVDKSNDNPKVRVPSWCSLGF